MPKYYFHIRDGRDHPDREGTELPDDAVAKAEAVIFAGSMLKDIGGKFWDGEDWLVIVVSDEGREVCTLKFSAQTR